jgi:hypothetical protein
MSSKAIGSPLLSLIVSHKQELTFRASEFTISHDGQLLLEQRVAVDRR